nr:hypothetical protein [candidate division Zixibacteria bacterium]
MTGFFKELASFNFNYVLDAVSWRLPDWLFKYVRTYLLCAERPKLLCRNYDSHFMRFADVDDIPLIVPLGISRRLIRERLDNGDRCLIMGKDNSVHTIIWASPGKRYLKVGGAILDPGDDGVIFYGGYTAEEVRMLGLFPTAFNAIYNSFVSEKRTRVYASIHSLNRLSYKTHIRMNFKPVGEATHFSLLGLKFTYYKYWPHRVKKFTVFIKVPPEGLFWN